ncbi:unnamed protein product [Owenia fusiformis]|uniref:Uncharacterized protein n=1 Tax=Owenia fusiformis TaxID=6347 RepID=A0A8J1TX58_OWEFU|nr:unnamed protein product [Owenia fusiformis]
MDSGEKVKRFLSFLIGSVLMDFLIGGIDLYCITLIGQSKDLMVLGAHDDGYPRYAILSQYVVGINVIAIRGKIGGAAIYMVKIRKFDMLPLLVMNTLMILFHDVGIGLFYWDYISIIGNGPSMHTSHMCILPRSVELMFNTLKLGYLFWSLRSYSDYDPVNQNPAILNVVPDTSQCPDTTLPQCDTMNEVDTMPNPDKSMVKSLTPMGKTDPKQSKMAPCKTKPNHWSLFAVSVLGYIGTIVILALIAPTPKALTYKEEYPPNFNKVEVYMARPGILEDKLNDATIGKYDTYTYVVPAESVMKVTNLSDIMKSKTKGKITKKYYDDDDGTVTYKTFTTKCLNTHHGYHNTTKQLGGKWCSKCKSDLEFMFRFYDPVHDMAPHGRLDYNMRTFINGSNNMEYLNLRKFGYDLYLFIPSPAGKEVSPPGDILLNNPWSGRFLKRLNYKMFKKCGISSAASLQKWPFVYIFIYIMFFR